MNPENEELRKQYEEAFFGLPAGASPNDRVVGQDELGNFVRRTIGGQEYTVSSEYPEDRRSGLEKTKEALGEATEAVTDYVKDPSLPTAEQAKDFAAGVAESAYEPFRKVAHGEGTYGDVAMALGEVAGGSAASVGKNILKNDPTELNVFAGRKNRTDLPLVEKYPQKKGGVTPDFQSALSSVKKDYAEQLEAAKNRGSGASEMFYTRSLSLLENADENLVRDIADAAYSEDPRDSARRLLYKYDESVIPDDVTISDLQELGIRLGQSFKGKLEPKETPSTQFRSATEEATQAMEVGKKGLLGARFLKQLKKNPDVRDTEWAALNLEVDPNRLYSKEELVDLVGKKAYDVSVSKANKFEVFQRQRDLGLADTEKEYFELAIKAKARDGATFKPKDNHYTEDTLAHTRASVRGPLEGVSDKDFILAEEFQSDLLQKGFLPAGKGSVSSVDENLLKVDTEFGTQLTQAIEEGYQDFVWDDVTEELDIVDLTPDSNPQVQLLQRWNELGEEEKRNIVSSATLPEGADRYQQTRQAVQKAFNKTTSDTYDIERVTETILRSAKPSEAAVRKPPIEKIGESVSLAIDSLVAEGQKRGITTLVIPPFEKIVEARYPKGSKGYLEAVSKKSGLYQTYVTAVDKKLKELQAIGGVSVEKVDMPYPKSYEGSVTDVLVNLSDEDLDKVFTRIYGEEYTSGDLGSRDRLFQNDLQEFAMNSDLEDFYRQTLRETNLLPAKVEQKLKGTKIDFSGLAEEKDLTRPRFAQGGMVEDDQMNRLMQEGGMADDGMNREPITGNEIPPGSLASEVRDDIPAQLSEGEYVVPADVLRYYGVRFFEDLRAQAKQGMMEMESDGRIGGAPVDAQGVPAEGQDEELTPEEEQMLMEAMGGGASPAGSARTAPARMAYGGMVQQQPMTTPYQDQRTMYQMPQGMAEGGMPSAPFDRTTFTLDDNAGVTGIQTRKYINPVTKETRTFNFIGSTPLGVIPEGFVPWTQEVQDQVNTAPIETSPTQILQGEQRGGSGKDRQDSQAAESRGYEGWAKDNADRVTSDPLGFGTDIFNDASAPKGLLGKTLSRGIIGDLQTLDAISQINAAKEFTKTPEEVTTLNGYVDRLTGTLSPAADIAVSTGFVASGGQRAKAIRDSLGTTTGKATGSRPAGTVTPVGGSGRSASTTVGSTPSKSPSRAIGDTGARVSGTATGGVGASKSATGTATGGARGSVAGAGASATGNVSFSGGKGIASGDKKGGVRGGSVGPMAKGGLVGKPSKSSPKGKKGLAS